MAVRTFAFEVALGGLLGAFGIVAATRVLGPLEDDIVLLVTAALALWCALFAGAIRLARALRSRVPPAVTLGAIALPALGVVAPVALQLAFTRGAATDPFSGWGRALSTASQTVNPTTFLGALAWATVVPFVLVGAPIAARPRAPLWATAVLGVCGGYLGLVASCELLVYAAPVLILGMRHALLAGVPFAVIGMGLARPPSPRGAGALLLAIVAVAPAMAGAVVGHSHHLVALCLRGPEGTPLVAAAAHLAPGAWLEQLDHPLPAARRRVLTALRWAGPRAVATAPALLRVAQRDGEVRVRADALAAFGAVVAGTPGDAALWSAVFELAGDEAQLVRYTARRVIVDHEHTAVGEALLAAIVEARRRDSPTVLRPVLGDWWREHGRLGWDLDGVLRSVVLIHDDTESASRFLSTTFSAEQLKPLLIRALDSGDPAVRDLAARRLTDELERASFDADERRAIEDALDR